MTKALAPPLTRPADNEQVGVDQSASPAGAVANGSTLPAAIPAVAARPMTAASVPAPSLWRWEVSAVSTTPRSDWFRHAQLGAGTVEFDVAEVILSALDVDHGLPADPERAGQGLRGEASPDPASAVARKTRRARMPVVIQSRLYAWLILSIMLCFQAEKLDSRPRGHYPGSMPRQCSPVNKPPSAAEQVRRRVRRGHRPRYWRLEEFAGLPPAAVAMALSRLAGAGELERVGRGLYYRSVPTAFGPSRPAPSATAARLLAAPAHPAGLTAANLLGFSAQNPRQPEYATSSKGKPRALQHAIVHDRRPPQRARLSPDDGAILEVLRERARSSDLPPHRTVEHLLHLLDDELRFRRLASAASAEPPRVRAMLGALGEELGMPPAVIARLRRSLNPLSRFDFGPLRQLPRASAWQAR